MCRARRVEDGRRGAAARTPLACLVHDTSHAGVWCPAGARPQPRPQMVVVENPPTMDDEGKMARLTCVRVRLLLALLLTLVTLHVQVSNMAVGVAQK